MGLAEQNREIARLLTKTRGERVVPLGIEKSKAFLKDLGTIAWTPELLFIEKSTKKYIACITRYDVDNFPTGLAARITSSQHDYPFDFFFLLNKQESLGLFHTECSRLSFGIILVTGGKYILHRDSVAAVYATYTGKGKNAHIPLWLAEAVEAIDTKNANFNTALHDFSNAYQGLYSNKSLTWPHEYQVVHDTLSTLLESDPRYLANWSAYDFLRKSELEKQIGRDHYFHSFQIFLMGLQITTRYLSQFASYYKNVFPRYDDFCLEYLWLLTAIFHDTGYVQDDSTRSTDVWDNIVYGDNLRQIASLFEFTLSDTKHRNDWRPEPHTVARQEPIRNVFRNAYVKCHGVRGCFDMLFDVFSEAINDSDFERNVFWINHVYPAALSIALHDPDFRIMLKDELGIGKLRLSRFPFAILLSYLDTLQDEGRELMNCSDALHLLKGFEFNGKVIAQIDEANLPSYENLGNLKAECSEFSTYVECDGIYFGYPDCLLVS